MEGQPHNECANLRTLTLALGAILVAYCSVGSVSEAFWPTNERVNHDLCRILLCNNAPLIRQAQDQLKAGTTEDLQRATGTFRMALQQDPHDPYRWIDLGDAFLEAGDKQDASYCFDQVLVLASHSASLLLSVANYYFDIGENQRALRITARILSLTPNYDSRIFTEYSDVVDNAEEILRFGLTEGPRAAKSWLRFLIHADRLEGAQRTWDWIVERGDVSDSLAGEYFEFLIRQGHPDWAASVWAKHTGTRPDEYGKSTYLFNGDFEAEPVPSPFDWKIGRANGVETTRDCSTSRWGKCSLRIRFSGAKNLGFAAVSQLAFMQPGVYQFRAFVRTQGLTTDQGIRFHISDAETPTTLNEIFGQFTGTTPWTRIEHIIVVPPKTRLVRIEVVRQPSMKFDNKIGGTAWVDGLTMESIASPSPR